MALFGAFQWQALALRALPQLTELGAISPSMKGDAVSVTNPSIAEYPIHFGYTPLTNSPWNIT